MSKKKQKIDETISAKSWSNKELAAELGVSIQALMAAKSLAGSNDIKAIRKVIKMKKQLASNERLLVEIRKELRGQGGNTGAI